MIVVKLKRVNQDNSIQYAIIKEDDQKKVYYTVQKQKVITYPIDYQIINEWSVKKLTIHFLNEGYKIFHEIKTEVDWLNAVQENFKEGV